MLCAISDVILLYDDLLCELFCDDHDVFCNGVLCDGVFRDGVMCDDVLVLQVPWVEEFYVYGNRVNSIPHEIAHLKKLTKLALNENLLTDLPGMREGGRERRREGGRDGGREGGREGGEEGGREREGGREGGEEGGREGERERKGGREKDVYILAMVVMVISQSC